MKKAGEKRPARKEKTMVKVRNAEEKDAERIIELLGQVLAVHAAIRPDIFRPCGTKYTKEELSALFAEECRHSYVAVDEKDRVLGYALCEEKFSRASTMIPRSMLYVDDLCVDESERGRGVGKALFAHVKEEAKHLGCYEVTLFVWEGNDAARAFYDKMGMKPKETQMEYIL